MVVKMSSPGRSFGGVVLGVPSLSRRHASLWESEELLSLIRDIGSQSPFLRASS